MAARKIQRILYLNALLVIPAAVSLYFGLRNAFVAGYSHDLQWSGAKLTYEHIDPYRQFLLHNPGHLLRTTQVPNYLHELYIFLLPLGMMSYSKAAIVWAAANCLFTLGTLLVLRRLYSLDGAKTVLLGLLLLCSVPFRIALASGTETPLELLLFCLLFSLKGDIKRGILLGLSYCKYSFSPVLFFYLAFQRRYRLLIISLLPPVLGLLIMDWLVHGNLMTLAIEPLLVSRNGVGIGAGDLMTLIRTYAYYCLSPQHTIQLAYLSAFLGSAVCGIFLARRDVKSSQRDAAMIAVASLMFFPHLIYDYIFLLIPAAACLAGSLDKRRVILLSAIGTNWFLIKFVPWFGLTTFVLRSVEIADFVLLTVIFTFLPQVCLADDVRNHEPMPPS